MGSVAQEITTPAHPDQVWDAVRDFSNPHKRLVVGFVVDAQFEDGARVVTFANGDCAKEPLVTIDDQTRRVVWSAIHPVFKHYNACLQVFDADGKGTRVVWSADFLPNETHDWVAGTIAAGLAAMKATLDKLA